MKDWYETMVEHLTLKGLAKRSIISYTSVMKGFLIYLGDDVEIFNVLLSLVIVYYLGAPHSMRNLSIHEL